MFRFFAALIVIPIIVVVGIVGLLLTGVVLTAAVLIPLVPFCVAALLIWLVVRAARPRIA